LPAPWPTSPRTHRRRRRHDWPSRVRGGASRRSHVNPRSVVASPAPTTPSSPRVVASRARTSAPHLSRSQQHASGHDSSQPHHRRTRQMSDQPNEQEIKDAVAHEMAEMAQEVESLTYAEVYDFDQEAIERAAYWQARAVV